MSELINRIRAAQVLAGERLVIEHLEAMGLVDAKPAKPTYEELLDVIHSSLSAVMCAADGQKRIGGHELESRIRSVLSRARVQP